MATVDTIFDRVFNDLAMGFTCAAARETQPEPVQEAPAETPPSADPRMEPYEEVFYVWALAVFEIDGVPRTHSSRSGPFRDRDQAEDVAAAFCEKPHVLCATVDAY